MQLVLRQYDRLAGLDVLSASLLCSPGFVVWSNQNQEGQKGVHMCEGESIHCTHCFWRWPDPPRPDWRPSMRDGAPRRRPYWNARTLRRHGKCYCSRSPLRRRRGNCAYGCAGPALIENVIDILYPSERVRERGHRCTPFEWRSSSSWACAICISSADDVLLLIFSSRRLISLDSFVVNRAERTINEALRRIDSKIHTRIHWGLWHVCEVMTWILWFVIEVATW